LHKKNGRTIETSTGRYQAGRKGKTRGGEERKDMKEGDGEVVMTIEEYSSRVRGEEKGS